MLALSAAIAAYEGLVAEQPPQEPVRHCLRHEAKEKQADVQPQAPKIRRRIRWNSVRIFRDREQRRCLDIVRRSRTANVRTGA